MKRVKNGIGRRSKNGKSHHPLACEMTPQEHFEYCEKKNEQQRKYRARKKLEREMRVNSLEEMCDLMCGGVENE